MVGNAVVKGLALMEAFKSPRCESYGTTEEVPGRAPTAALRRPRRRVDESANRARGAGERVKKSYEKCHKENAEIDLLRVDGSTVYVEFKGKDAKDASGLDDATDDLADSGEFDEDTFSGLAPTLALLSAVECLVDATDYPGQSDDLTDGESWDGWKYKERDGAGAEVTLSFTATA